MKIGRVTAFKSTKGEVYCYRILNGLSTDAYFLSKKNNPCEGFNQTEDFCFRALGAIIYYKVQGDTVFVYTSYPAPPPENFGFNVVQKKIASQEDDKYEKMYRDGQVQKIIIDSLYTPKCDIKY